MKRAAPLAKALLGFGLSVSVALALLARSGSDSPGLANLAALCALALLGFAIGLLPAALLGGSIRFPFLAGAGVGLFWLALALAGKPYDLGLKAPAGIAILSVFLGVFVSGAAIGAALLKSEAE